MRDRRLDQEFSAALEEIQESLKVSRSLKTICKDYQNVKRWFAVASVLFGAFCVAIVLGRYAIYVVPPFSLFAVLTIYIMLRMRAINQRFERLGIVLQTRPQFPKSLPRLWELFSFILPPKVKREAFDPAYNDMRERFQLALRYSEKWEKRWLKFAFAVQTTYMVLDCFRVMLQSGTGKVLLNFLPDALRNWWRRQ